MDGMFWNGGMSTWRYVMKLTNCCKTLQRCLACVLVRVVSFLHVACAARAWNRSAGPCGEGRVENPNIIQRRIRESRESRSA